MPNWTNVAPAEPRGPALPIKRTPAFKPLTAIVTAEELIGCYTHFFKGHTVPCEAPDCEACGDGIPFRWHAYFSAIDTQNNLHFIFETTAAGSEQFTLYQKANGSLRGCLFKAERLNKRPNGRILVQTRPADLTERVLPPAPDLTKCLAILWSLPTENLDTSKRNGERHVKQTTVILPEKPPTQ